MGATVLFSHIMIGANDIEASRKFYDALFGALGCDPGIVDPHGRVIYITPTGIFAVSKPLDGGTACGANGGTIGFQVKSPAEGDAWHAAGLTAGGIACEDPPGIREGTRGKIYLAYLRDPTGNKICASHRF